MTLALCQVVTLLSSCCFVSKWNEITWYPEEEEWCLPPVPSSPVLNELNAEGSGDETSFFDSTIGEHSLCLTQTTLALNLTSGLNAKRKPLDWSTKISFSPSAVVCPTIVHCFQSIGATGCGKYVSISWLGILRMNSLPTLRSAGRWFVVRVPVLLLWCFRVQNNTK